MELLALHDEQPPARMVAGALAHLARHMETGCQQAARLAGLLLERVASDPEADRHLRKHARELVDILERDYAREKAAEFAPVSRFAACAEYLADGLPARKTA